MTRIRKAVIPAAGMGTRQYPASGGLPKGMFTVVDRDGLTKAAIQIVVEEVQASGIEAICIVVRPGDEELYQRYFTPISGERRPAFARHAWALEQSEYLGRLREMITYVPQPTPHGYGHAVYCAREWVDDEPFLLLLSDHAFISDVSQPCARQLIDVFEQCGQSVYALQRISEDRLRFFGTIQGEKVQENPPVYRLTHIREKPDVAYARQHFRVEGVPDGMYLSFFGQHALTPGIFDALEYHIRHDIREQGEFQLTSAQEFLRRQEGAYGCEIQGESHDMGIPLGLLEAQVALAIHGVNRSQIARALHGLLHQ
ncbi:MAG: sugar phosphate nucleotidyltransferase [Anaerolineae bacterium]